MYLYLSNTLPLPNWIAKPSAPCTCTLGLIDIKAKELSCNEYISSLKLVNELIAPYLPSSVITSLTDISVQLSINSPADFNLVDIILVSKLLIFLIL